MQTNRFGMAKIRQKREKECLKTSPFQSIEPSSESEVDLQSKTSPCHSIIASIESEIESSAPNQVKTLKIKTLREIQDDLLLANYAADKSIENLRFAIKKRDQNKLSRENKLFKPVFKDLRIDGELVFFENRLLIPKDLRIAVINSLHKGHPGRDAMLASVDEVWLPQIHRQIVAQAKTCQNCQRAGKNLKTLKNQKQFGKIRTAECPNEEIALDFMGPFINAPEGRKFNLVALDHFTAYTTLKFVKNTSFSSVEKF